MESLSAAPDGAARGVARSGVGERRSVRRAVCAVTLGLLAVTACASSSESGSGVWYVDTGDEMDISTLDLGGGEGGGTWLGPDRIPRAVRGVVGGEGDGPISFQEDTDVGTRWFRGTVHDGLVFGRWAEGRDASEPAPEAYSHHFTGWNRQAFERELTPRVFDILLNGEDLATLRIDRRQDGRLVGRLKTWATQSNAYAGEQEEYDLAVDAWDGHTLRFREDLGADASRTFEGTVSGRTVHGSYVESTSPDAPFEWHGTRTELLAYGLAARTPEARRAWQDRTRAHLVDLMMGGERASTPLDVTPSIAQPDASPFWARRSPRDRDDDPGAHPREYHLQEINLLVHYPNPYGRTPLERNIHGWLARPDAPPPPGGYPAFVAVNGHTGSAHACFDPNSVYFWYGDAFARRGYVVFAIDISHRPYEERYRLYTDAENGDDPGFGNGAHPSIHADGFDSDWEEDGERAADTLRAREYVASLPEVSSAPVGVVGLSMGGEVTTYAAAFDPSFGPAVVAGFSPDWRVMEYGVNHRCYKWQHASLLDYVSDSDLHALIAPRPLVIETGKQDLTFSISATPFAADKQVVRRSRAAYAADNANLVHYLHYDVHHFHVGDFNPQGDVERDVRVPALARPIHGAGVEWQTDPTTRSVAPTLFDLLDQLAPRGGG